MSKSKSITRKPVLQWMLKESENELHVLERIVHEWPDINGTLVAKEEIEKVVKALGNVSTRIVTADEYNLVLPQLPLIGRILTTLIGMPSLLDSSPDLHRNVLRCLVNLNRTKSNASSIRVKARLWALKALRQMCRLKNDVAVCRQVGFTNSDLGARMRRDVLRTYRRKLKTESTPMENESEIEGHSLLQRIISQKDFQTEDCVDDVISCLKCTRASPSRTEMIEAVCTHCDSGELNFTLSSRTLIKLWSIHPPSFEKTVLQLMKQCTEPGPVQRITDVLDHSTVLSACAQDANLLKAFMDIVVELVPFDASRFSWLPTLIIRTVVRKNPGIELSHFSRTLQPVLVFLSMPVEESVCPLIIDSLYECIKDHLRLSKTRALKHWFKDWYFRCLILILRKSSEKNLMVGLWLNGCSRPPGESALDELVTLGRVLESGSTRIIVSFLEEHYDKNLALFEDFICDLIIMHTVNYGLSEEDPLTIWTKKLKSSECVDEFRESLRMLCISSESDFVVDQTFCNE